MKTSRNVLLGVAALALVSTPAMASNTATFTVSFVVPLQCEVVVLGSAITEKRVVVDIARTCNSRHALVVSGSAIDGLGAVSVGSAGMATRSGLEATFLHREQYTPAVEQLIFECPDAQPGAIEQFASTIALNMEAN